MTQHPYVGLAGTVRRHPYSGPEAGKNDRHGVIVAVSQGGSVNENDGAYLSAVYLTDDGKTNETVLFHFVPDDPAEARRRLTGATREWSGPDRWQVWHGARASQPDNNPDKYGEPPDGFTPIGPWKFVAVYETSDCGPSSVWERPLRRVSRG